MLIYRGSRSSLWKINWNPIDSVLKEVSLKFNSGMEPTSSTAQVLLWSALAVVPCQLSLVLVVPLYQKHEYRQRIISFCLCNWLKFLLNTKYVSSEFERRFTPSICSIKCSLLGWLMAAGNANMEKTEPFTKKIHNLLGSSF